jgi:hypothetical protein
MGTTDSGRQPSFSALSSASRLRLKHESIVADPMAFDWHTKKIVIGAT